MARLCYAVVASPLHDRELLERVKSLVEKCHGVSAEFKGIATSAEELAKTCSGCRGLVILVGTGGTEEIVVNGLKGYRGPLLLVAHPYANSLPALLEMATALREAGSPFHAVFVPELEGPRAVSIVGHAMRVLKAAAELRGARLGVIGDPSPWLVYSRATETDAARLDLKPVKLGLEELYKEYSEAEPPLDVASRLKEAGLEPPPKALKLYGALRRLVKRHGLQGVTLRCFEVAEKLGVTPCLALALLNDEGIAAACEGDVPLLATMLLMSRVYGKPVFMGNPAVVENHKLLLAHCTAPLSLGVRAELMPHFETGKPVAVAVHFPEGAPVILARMDAGLRTLRLAHGRVLCGSPAAGAYCRTQVWLELSGSALKILEEPMGNHYAMTLASPPDSLEVAARLLGLRVERL